MNSPILSTAQITTALEQLMAWPLRVTQVRGLFSDAWGLRANLTFADAVYVALAEHLGADLLTDDHKLAGAPNSITPAARRRDPTNGPQPSPR